MPNPIRTIMVGVAALDDQDPRTPGGADPVLGPAVSLASAMRARLHAVHAFEIPGELEWLVGGGDGGAGGSAYVQNLQDRLERQLASVPGGEAALCRVLEGSAAEVLCRTAPQAGAELLIVGASRRGRAWSGILGSTAAQVIAWCAIPVLVVHRPFAGPPRRVLLASDLSPSGTDVVRRGIAAAGLLNGGTSELRCLHVVDLDPLVAPPAADDVLEAIAAARLDRSLDEAGFDRALMERRVRVGEAAGEITREAMEWGAELLVLGTQRATADSPRRAGHVAVAAVRGASCNVLVIPASGARVEEGPPGAARADAASAGAVMASA